MISDASILPSYERSRQALSSMCWLKLFVPRVGNSLRVPRRRLQTGTIALLLVTSSSSSLADEGLQVTVACAELDPEQRAAIQARQLSELRTRGIDEGTLMLACSVGQVSGTWSRAGENYAQRTMSREPSDDVSELLQLLGGIVIDTRQSTPLPPREEQEPIDEVPEVESKQNVALATVAEQKDQKRPQPEPQQPKNSTPAFNQESEGQPTAPPVWSLGLGVAFQLWGTAMVGTLGPEVEVAASWKQTWGCALRVGAQFGLQNPREFSLRDYHIGALALWSPVERVRFGLGPFVSLLDVTAPQLAVGNASSLTTWGASVRGQYAYEMSGFSLFANTGLDWLATRREILLNDEVVIQVPTWQGVLTLGLETRF